VTQDVSARLRRVEQQIRAFSKLHSSELQLILDELTDISKQLEEEKAAASAETSGPADTAKVDPADPAASSPKRAKWLAEQERKAAPKTRRDLLFRGDKEP
jgi:uncharacterized membrane protein